MSRRPLSLKSRGVSKRRGTRHKQSSWQTSINSYFGGKAPSVQPTLNHFVQKRRSVESQSGDPPLSLDKISINDRASQSNTNIKKPTTPTTTPHQDQCDSENTNTLVHTRNVQTASNVATTTHQGIVEGKETSTMFETAVKYERDGTSSTLEATNSVECRDEVVRDTATNTLHTSRAQDKVCDGASEKQKVREIKSECSGAGCSTELHRDNGATVVSGGGVGVDGRRVLQEHSLNVRPQTSEHCSQNCCGNLNTSTRPQSSSIDSDLLSTMPCQPPVKSECHSETSRPPLSELLIDPALVVRRKLTLNPFAKLDSLTSSAAKSAVISGSINQGLTPKSSGRVGLSLRVRKRKFVMSPSKPRQEKPVKQVLSDHGGERPHLFTPPHTATPSHPHKVTSSHHHTPSLFSPCDRDLLDQYSTPQHTPCRRLSLADLEVDGATKTCGSDGSVSDDVITKSCDPQVTCQPSAYPSNYSFSSHDEAFFDKALVSESCETHSKSHDISGGSHDLFDQSHDSFDELIRHTHTANIDAFEKTHDHPTKNTTSATLCDFSDSITKSHDPNDDVTRSHDQTDDITGRSHDLTRHLVLEAVQQQEAGGRGERGRPELRLRLLDQTTLRETEVCLRDEWVHIQVSPGDTVQVNPPPEWNGDLRGGKPCVIDGSNRGNVIVSPDMLITPTAIATSVTCPRKAILADIFKGISKDSVAMVIGNLLHQVMQGVLVKWAESRDERDDVVVGVARDDVEEKMRAVLSTTEALNHLYSLGMTDGEALSLLTSLSPSLLDWCDRFLQPSPLHSRGQIEFKRNACDGDGMVCIAVDKVHDIEENIWSPRLGLKGKVDATLQIKMRRGRERECSYRVPLEIKTGKMYRKQGSLEHRAQLSLYSLMLRDRYSEETIPGGLLYYMKAGHMQGLPAEDHDIRSLLMARNSVAAHHRRLTSHMALPSMLRDTHVCKFCPYLPQCCLTHKSLEQGTAETSGLGELFEANTQHLSQKHLNFFSHWTGLVMREKGRGRGEGREFWKYSSHEREAEGLAMADMRAHSPQQRHSTNRYLQKFTRVVAHLHSSSNSHPHTFTLNERVVVSRQDGSAWAIAMGMVTMATDTEVELSLDRPVMCDGAVYRLDVAPPHHGSTSLVNLATLCTSDSERDAQLRDLIIDLRPPCFTHSPPPLDEDLSTALNENQKSAVSKVLCAKDYCLILGRPGTGKTTTISRLIQTLLTKGASTLVTSYTHSAVDNILFKLKEVF